MILIEYSGFVFMVHCTYIKMRISVFLDVQTAYYNVGDL